MDVVTKDPLGRYARLRTADPDELGVHLSRLFSVRSIDLLRGGKAFDAVLNHRQINDIGLTYARYRAPMEATLENSGHFLQGFPLRGSGHVVIDGASGKLSRSRGVIGGPEARLALCYPPNFRAPNP